MADFSTFVFGHPLYNQYLIVISTFVQYDVLVPLTQIGNKIIVIFKAKYNMVQSFNLTMIHCYLAKIE